MQLFKILGQNGKAIHGGEAIWPLPKNSRKGAWTLKIDQVEARQSGWHLVEAYGLIEWLRPGCAVYLAEGRGDQDRDGFKIAFSQARLIRRLVWSDVHETSWWADILERAIRHAEGVQPLFKIMAPDDDRPMTAINAARIVLGVLRGTTGCDVTAAEATARAAAEATARAAAWAEAWTAWAAADAAWAAADVAWAAADVAANAAWAAAWAADVAWSAGTMEKAWQTQRLLWYLGLESTEPLISEGF